MFEYTPITEGEVRYIQRLPGQLAASLRKTRALLTAHRRYGMGLDEEARMLLEALYGPDQPGLEAEVEYQTYAVRKAGDGRMTGMAVRRAIREEMQ